MSSTHPHDPASLQEVERLRRRIDDLERQLREARRQIKRHLLPQTQRPSAEAHLRLLAENAPGVVYLCKNDARYTMLYLTDSVEDLTGYPAQAFLDDRVSFVELYHPDDAAAIAPEVDAALEKREPFRRRYRIKHRDGHWVWINEAGTGVFEGDELMYLEGFLSDVTEHEMAQRELRHTHDKLNLHFQHAPLGVLEWGPNWRLARWSTQAERIFGWKAEEVVGKSWDEWRFVHPDDLDLVSRTGHELASGQKRYNTCRNRNFTKSGQVLHIQWFNSVLCDDDGQFVSTISFLHDITEQVQAEHALRTSERRYREIIDTAYEGVWILDPDANTTLVNARMAQMLGWTIESMLGTNLMDYTDPADRPRVREMLRRRESGISEHYESRFKHRDGGYVWVIISASPVFDASGHYAGTVGMVTDITDRTRAEAEVHALNADLEQRVAERTAELREVNNRLKDQISEREQIARALREQSDIMQLMLDNTAEGMIVADKSGRFLIWNAAATQIAGLGAQDVPIEKWPEVYRCYLADGQTLCPPEEFPLAQAIAGKSVDEAVLIIRRDDESAGRYLSVNARPLVDDSGALLGGVAVFRDTTEHRHAEYALRLIQAAVDQVGDSVVITDAMIDSPGPRILYVNPAFTRMTGYTEAEVIGRTPRVLQGPRTERALLDRLRKSLEAGEVFHGWAVNYRKDRTAFDIEWHIAPVRNEDGQITHWVSIQRDITELREQEDIRRQQQTELAHVARLSTMGEMASGLAHELNQPLAAIANYISGCFRRLDTGQISQEQLREALLRVGQQAERAGQIIHRLREFVKKGEPKRQPIDVNYAVREAVGLMEHDARAVAIPIRLHLGQDLPKVEADLIQIEQVILNLVRNALEASETTPGQPSACEVTVSTVQDAQAGMITIDVADQGVGVSTEDLDQIFNPFFTTKPAGIGMGLNISQSIAEAHQGRLTASRNTVRGMTFHFMLPAAPVP